MKKFILFIVLLYSCIIVMGCNNIGYKKTQSIPITDVIIKKTKGFIDSLEILYGVKYEEFVYVLVINQLTDSDAEFSISLVMNESQLKAVNNSHVFYYKAKPILVRYNKNNVNKEVFAALNFQIFTLKDKNLACEILDEGWLGTTECEYVIIKNNVILVERFSNKDMLPNELYPLDQEYVKAYNDSIMKVRNIIIKQE